MCAPMDYQVRNFSSFANSALVPSCYFVRSGWVALFNPGQRVSIAFSYIGRTVSRDPLRTK
jgi:hypothetical protein